MERIGIIGAGSWGTALAVLLCANGHEVTVWSHRPEEARRLRDTREHTAKLPGVRLSEDISFTDSLSEAAADKDICVLAVPSSAVRETCRRLQGLIKPGQILVDVAKGVEEHTLFTMTEIMAEELPQANVGVLSGPSHAEEVGRGLPTTCVVGAHDKKTAQYLQNAFISPVFRVYTSPDMKGIELGGALKNVIALAAGMADGLGYGDNTKAALITRGIAEIARLGVAMGGRLETFYGLAGIGDLIVTCASVHSRNRRAGILIGKGYSMEEAMQSVNMVVEGVYSAKAGLEMAQKCGVEMPIVQQVNAILFGGKRADEAVRELMMRDRRMEYDGEWR